MPFNIFIQGLYITPELCGSFAIAVSKATDFSLPTLWRRQQASVQRDVNSKLHLTLVRVFKHTVFHLATQWSVRRPECTGSTWFLLFFPSADAFSTQCVTAAPIWGYRLNGQNVSFSVFLCRLRTLSHGSRTRPKVCPSEQWKVSWPKSPVWSQVRNGNRNTYFSRSSLFKHL